MNKLILLFFLSVFLISGCFIKRKNKRQSDLQNAPEWVRHTPVDPAYYHGIGTAIKTGQPDYRERARKIAFSEIASSISVTISSQSLLIQIDTDKNFSEFFKDQIRLTTQEELEGYELVDSWENENQYWVYYRLSRAKWEQIKQNRISKAVSLSYDKFENAGRLARERQYADALRFYILAFEDIRNFLGEDLRVSGNDSGKSYSTELLTTLLNLLRNIQIRFSAEKLLLKVGSYSKNPATEALVVDNSGKPVSGIPVLIRYSWLPGATVQVTSDNQGKIIIPLEKPEKFTGTYQISSQIHWEKIVRENTTDPTIRRLLEGFKMNIFQLYLELIPPICKITLYENLPQFSSPGVNLRGEIEKIIQADGIRTISSEKGFDFECRFDIRSTALQEKNNRFSSLLSVQITIQETGGKTLYKNTLNDLQGIGSTQQSATEDALKAFISRFRITIYPELRTEILKY